MHGYTLLGRCQRLAGLDSYIAEREPFGLQASAKLPKTQAHALASCRTWADVLQKLRQNVQPPPKASIAGPEMRQIWPQSSNYLVWIQAWISDMQTIEIGQKFFEKQS